MNAAQAAMQFRAEWDAVGPPKCIKVNYKKTSAPDDCDEAACLS